jgi:pimeloyl-ACP methyl ester carboxylesterase
VVVLIGSSAGGSIAFHVLRNYPELVRGAVLSEPGLLSLDPDGGATFLAGLGACLQPFLTASDKRPAMDAFFEYIDPGAWAAIPEARREKYRDN